MATNLKKINKGVAVLLTIVVLLLSLSPIFANKARAQWVVWDPGNFVPNTVTAVSTTISAQADVAQEVKEYGLDAVLYAIMDLVIQRLTASTINWINSGFRGKPAFVTDPQAYFLDIGNKVAGQFIFSNPKLNFLCGDMSAQIKIALSQTYTGRNEYWQCTLTDVQGNIDDFMNDFERGGWDKFFALTQERQNNPIGIYIQAEGEMFRRIADEVGEKGKQLDWGRGFLSFEICGEEGRDTDGVCIGEAAIATPGSIIEGQLGEVLSIGGKKLAVADEINEMLSALLNQLVGRIIGGIGGGLRGLSGPDSSGGNRVFTNELAPLGTENIIDSYYQSSIESVEEVLTAPPYEPPVCGENPDLPECQPPELPPYPSFNP